MRESVAGSWTTTWETIIGDADQAKALWTGVSNTISPMVAAAGEARNKLLGEWRDLGGRTILIDALSNTFKGLMSILKPIGDAFREMFPATTATGLLAFTVAFRDLVKNFKIGAETSANLKSTFKGLFAILSIGKQIFGAVFSGIFSMMGGVGTLGDSILRVTGTIGNWLVGLESLIKKSDIFNNVIKNLVSGIKFVGSAIKTVIGSIQNGVSEFLSNISKNFSFPGFEAFHEFLNKMTERMSNVGKEAGNMKGGVGIIAATFGILGQTLTIIWGLVKTVAGGIGDLIVKMVDVLAKAFNGASFSGMLDLIAGLSLGGIAIGISKFLKSIVKPLEGFKEIFGGVTGILDGARGSFEAYQTKLKAGVLLKIAIAIGILALGVALIASIDSEKLVSSLSAMGTLFGTLLTSMAIFNKIGASSIKSALTATVMITMSIAILILAGAMKKLGELSWEQIAKGEVAIAGLSIILVASAKLLSSNEKHMMKGAAGMVVFALALKIMASVCADLAKLSWKEMSKGLFGIGILLAEISIFLNTAKFSLKAPATAIGILILAGAMKILASACEDFGNMAWAEIRKGLVSIGVLLAEIAIFTRVTGDAKHVVSTGVALLIIAGAMKVLASALQDFGSMSWKDIGKGLVSMGGALAIIAIAVNLMPKNLIFTATGLVIISSALLILAHALQSFGTMTWDEIGRGLTVLAASLLILSIALYAMNGTIVGSAALLIAAGAIAILVPALSLLGAMSWESIIKGLVMLSGIFVILGVSALVLGPLLPVIIGLAASLVLLGVGVIAIGAGLLLVGTGLTAIGIGIGILAGAVATGAAGIVASLSIIIIGVAALIPAILSKLGEGILAFCKVIIEGIPALCKAIEVTVIEIMKTIVKLTPIILNGVFQILSDILKSLIEWAPKILIQVLDLLLALVKVIIDYLPKIIEAAIKIVIAIVDGINAGIDGVIDAAFRLIIAFINGLANAIRNNDDAIYSACGNLLGAIIDSIAKLSIKLIDSGAGLIEDLLKGIGSMAKDMFDVGVNVVKGLLEGVASWLRNVYDAGANLGRSVLDSVKKTLGIHSPSKAFKDEVGVMIGIGMADGIKESTPVVETAASKMAKGALDAAKKWIDERKYYNNLTLEEELYVWETLQGKYKAGNAARIESDKEVYRLKAEIIAKDKADSEAAIQAKKDSEKAIFDDAVSTMDDLKYYDKLTLEEEYSNWKLMQQYYAEGTDERIKANKEVYRLEKELNSKRESDAKDLADLNTSYAEKIVDVEKDTNEKRTKLQDDYYAKTKEINDKQISDIDSLNKSYEDAVKSRASSLYSSRGLFDKVTSGKPASGATLLKNLKDQAVEFATYTENINGLAGKNISTDLLDELRAMGPSSLSEIKALNNLTAPELDTYVDLWQKKHEEAKKQAVSELEGLRLETTNKVTQINLETATALSTLTSTWLTAMNTLNTYSSAQLNVLNSEWATKVAALTVTTTVQVTNMSKEVVKTVDTMRKDTETVFVALTDSIQTIMSTPDWSSVGSNIIDGIRVGVISKANELANAMAMVAYQALAAAKAALGIHSPSTEFAKVGVFVGQGFINGIASYATKVAVSAGDLGTEALNSISNAIAGISDIVTNGIDSEPVIRPVFDLSNIQNGSKQLYNMMTGLDNYSVNGSFNSANSAAKSIQSNRLVDNSDVGQNSAVGKAGAVVSFTQNNYSPTALSRLDIYRQTKNQISTIKGVVGTV